MEKSCDMQEREANCGPVSEGLTFRGGQAKRGEGELAQSLRGKRNEGLEGCFAVFSRSFVKMVSHCSQVIALQPEVPDFDIAREGGGAAVVGWMQRPPSRVFALGSRVYAQYAEDNLW